MTSISIAYLGEGEFLDDIIAAEDQRQFLERAFGLGDGGIYTLEILATRDSLKIYIESEAYFVIENFHISDYCGLICIEVYYDQMGERQNTYIYRGKSLNVKALNEKLLKEDASTAMLLSVYRDKIQLFNKAAKLLDQYPESIFGVNLFEYALNNCGSKIIDGLSRYLKSKGIKVKVPFDRYVFWDVASKGDVKRLAGLVEDGFDIFGFDTCDDNPLCIMHEVACEILPDKDPVPLIEWLIDYGIPFKGKGSEWVVLNFISCPLWVMIDDDSEEYLDLNSSIRIIELFERHGFDLYLPYDGASSLYWSFKELRPYLKGRGVSFYSSDEQYQDDRKLKVAIDHDDKEAFDRFLSKENIQACPGDMIFESAIKWDDDYYIIELIKAGASPDFKERYGNDFMRKVISDRRFDLVSLMVDNGVDFTPYHKNSGYELSVLLKDRDFDSIKELQKIGIDCRSLLANALTYEGLSDDERFKFVEVILAGGVNPNVVVVYNHFYRSVLRLSKEKGFEDIERLLLDNGADDAKDMFEVALVK